jgi:hypothetical protein
LVGLDYVLEESVDAAVIVGGGIHVNIPGPARFALHKLWLASERSAAEAAKARKDLRQAEQILEVLADDRPGDVSEAWVALGRRKSLMRGAKASLQRLAPALRDRLRVILNGTR